MAKEKKTTCLYVIYFLLSVSTVFFFFRAWKEKQPLGVSALHLNTLTMNFTL